MAFSTLQALDDVWMRLMGVHVYHMLQPT
jgi:hypothetical protein